jgi:hypothetical protein
MVSRDVPEFLAVDYLEYVNPTLIYLASPYASPSAAVREARLEAVRHVCGKLVNEGRIVLSPMVYLGELALDKGVHPPQGWYAFDLQLLARSDELHVLQLPGWEDSKGVLVEIAGAQTKGIPVRLMSLEEAELPTEILERLYEGVG